jgi:acyl-CoA synthetase (AMP-forming)/AMP-acid ligase II
MPATGSDGVSFNLSELFELVVDAVPQRTAVVTGDRRLTYEQLEERANRLAHHLSGLGIGPGDHVGLHLVNGHEYLEGMLAAYKLRAVPVNINYRYVTAELQHLYESMDLAALIVHRRFVAGVEPAAALTPTLRHVLLVDDGGDDTAPDSWVGYENALAPSSPERDFTGRSSDDLYCACTGGTTGLPKGVMWRHEDIFFTSLGAGDPTFMQGPITAPGELTGRIPDQPLSMLVLPPLMHVSAHWAAFNALYGGGKIVLTAPGSFDAADCWRLIESEDVNLVVLVGNAMARPLFEYLAEHPRDVPTLFGIGSGGAVLSPSTKDRIHQLLPNVMVIDGFGSTETGVAGSSSDAAGGATPSFRMNDTTVVLDDELRPVEPGSGVIGRLARRGRIPLGYYKDPEKTAATFVERDGVRWVLPGDLASVEADGAVVVHGRGSVSINTGGEKVFPEEVESVLLGHQAVDDALVVGIPDDQWGQRLVAVVQPRSGATPTLDELQAHARSQLAGYKLPRELVLVEQMPRGPNGKPDYGAARERAIASVRA